MAGKIYLLSGFDDGVICLQDLGKMKGNSVHRPVFQTRQGDDEAQALDQGSYDQWHEAVYEHPDSIISVETSAPESSETAPAHILSASKDGTVYVWTLKADESHATDEILTYVADLCLDEPITKAKWLNDKTFLVATTMGNVYSVALEKDSQEAECLSKPKLVTSTEHGVAVWDLAVFSNGSTSFEVWLAEDSGKVT